MATRMIHSRDGSMMGTYFVAIVQYQASMLGGNVAGSAHYYCCQLSFCWLVACQSCGPLQLHWGMWMSSSWGESKKCFEAQDGWLFFWGAYGTRSDRPCSISFPASPGPQRIFEPPQHKKATDNGDPNPPMPMHHRWIYHPKPPPPTVVGRYRPIMSEEWIVLCTYPYFRCLNTSYVRWC